LVITTRVALAARGARKLGDTVEDIQDQEQLAQIRRQARRVYSNGLMVALLLTLLALVPR
jgi:hypothetical protein